MLPSPWKFPELTTCSLEPVQVNGLFRDVDLERQNAECKVGIGLRRSCRLCLQTKCHPVCLASLVCRVQPGVGWGDHQGFRGQLGLLFLSPISSSTPTLTAFLQPGSVSDWSHWCIEGVFVSGSHGALMFCGIGNVVGVYILSVFIFLGDLVKFPCARSVSCRPAAFI